MVTRMAMVTLFLLILAATAIADEEKSNGGLLDWTERVHLSGTIEGAYDWEKYGDVGDKNSDSASDLFISTVELGVEVEFTDWITGNLLFLAEDLGTDDETDVTVDEAMISLQKEAFPVYLVVGKMALPFGIFESHLVSDPMTQDAYETSTSGITIGFTGPLELDISATLYKGEEQMDHLFESELFDTDVIARSGDGSDNVESFILSAFIAPLPEYLRLFGGFISEPGSRERNNTVNVGLNFVINDLRIDCEYMKAIKREKYEGFSRDFKESVFSISVAYEFVMRVREMIGGALFAERKAHIVSEPLEVAARYEHFDDDEMASVSQTWSVEDRYGIGVRYAFYQDPESELTAYIGTEYRHTEYSLHPSQRAIREDDNDELFVRVGVSF